MADLLDTHVYSVIGEEGFRRLVAAFYRRVATDDILSPMYPKKDMAGAEERLRGFLIQRFGGPDHYSQRRGHPRLRMRHAPFKITQAIQNTKFVITLEDVKQNVPVDDAIFLRP